MSGTRLPRCAPQSAASKAWLRGWVSGHEGLTRPPGSTGPCCSGRVSGAPPLPWGEHEEGTVDAERAVPGRPAAGGRLGLSELSFPPLLSLLPFQNSFRPLFFLPIFFPLFPSHPSLRPTFVLWGTHTWIYRFVPVFEHTCTHTHSLTITHSRTCIHFLALTLSSGPRKSCEVRLLAGPLDRDAQVREGVCSRGSFGAGERKMGTVRGALDGCGWARGRQGARARRARDRLPSGARVAGWGSTHCWL